MNTELIKFTCRLKDQPFVAQPRNQHCRPLDTVMDALTMLTLALLVFVMLAM